MVKFAFMFFGDGYADAAKRERDAKKLKIPSHYIQFLNDMGNLDAILGSESAEEVLQRLNKINVESRLMRDPNYFDTLILAFTIYTMGTPNCRPKYLRSIFNEVAKYKDDLKSFIEITTAVEGTEPEGKRIGKAAQAIKLKHIKKVWES
jgi:hypothetical protein